MKVFLDTNIWLSAIVFPGLCAELLLRLMGDGHGVLTTALVRTETHAVMRRKFPHHAAALARFDQLWACARQIDDMESPAGDADARLVAAAAQAGAALFITGDQRVLGWGQQGSLRIVSPREAWMLITRPPAAG